MPELAEKNKCCGCGACANICPINCISMKADETGFLFPFVDDSKCIHCHKCEHVCPALADREKRHCKANDGKRFIVQNRSEEILFESTSGGAFTAFAEQIISDGGIAFGACMDAGFHVKHTHVSKCEELKIFRNSKYVQSDIGYTYRECQRYLLNGKKVIFSGTPCQIAGLKKYLEKEYDNLFLVDVMCRAVPSPKLFKKYIDLCRTRLSSIERLVFRDKAFGYSYSTMSVYGEKKGKKKVYRKSRYLDEWHRLFFEGNCNREICYSCPYQYGTRESDITAWECYDTYKLARSLNNNKGATNIIAWTKKGNEMIDNVRDRLIVNEIEFDPLMEILYRETNDITKKDVPNIYRDAECLSAKDFFDKYTPKSFSIYILEFLRRAALILGIHDFMRNIIRKIRDVRKQR